MLDRLDHFLVRAVTQQFEDLGQQPFALVGAAGAADLGHLLHEPGEDLRGLIVDRAMNGFDDCPMAVITTQ